MFPARWFTPSYWARRYWAKRGAVLVPIPGDAITTEPAVFRRTLATAAVCVRRAQTAEPAQMRRSVTTQPTER